MADQRPITRLNELSAKTSLADDDLVLVYDDALNTEQKMRFGVLKEQVGAKATVTTSSGTNQTLPAALDDRVVRVGSVAGLRALIIADFTGGEGARITATSRAGSFVWRTGDQSANVTADEITVGEGDGGRWVAPASDKTGASGAWELEIDAGVLYSGAYDVEGNNAGSPYDAQLRKLFTASASDDVTEVAFPNKTITFDNSGGPLSFQNNCVYRGGRSTLIQPTDNSQRVFATSGKSGFEISRLKSYISEAAGAEDTYIGGGYWRFDNCTDFDMEYFEVSRSFGTGLKIALCSDFRLSKFKTLYNQFSGWELEGCSDYEVKSWKSNKNGRYSADDTYKPLPTGWVGTHGGRGYTIGANGDTVDQENSIVANGQAILNSEYGIRDFTANTKGIQNLKKQNLYLKDNGHPAGTYGTVVLGSDKGVDLLVNSDATGESDSIVNESIRIDRSLGYGQPISIDGFNHESIDVKVRLTGSALHTLPGFSLFGAKNYRQINCRSIGANQHIAFGSNNPQNVEVRHDRAEDCLEYKIGTPGGNNNLFYDIRATHRSTTAVAGENGYEISENVDLIRVKFIGFWQGIVYSSGDALLDNVTTENSANLGFRNFANTSTTLIQKGCDFDSVSPFDKTIVISDGGGVRQVSFSLNAGIPTTGYYKAGSVVWDITPDALDPTHNRRLLGWRRLTTGTGHVLNTDWEEMWIHSDASTA